MVEYKNIASVKCWLIDSKWKCDITRRLSDEVKQVDNQLCFITKTETVHDLENVSLKEGANVCEVQSIGEKSNFLECK